LNARRDRLIFTFNQYYDVHIKIAACDNEDKEDFYLMEDKYLFALAKIDESLKRN
ncbi:hypothetical protein JYU34_015171, partial [Plutella xylostella]